MGRHELLPGRCSHAHAAERRRRRGVRADRAYRVEDTLTTTVASCSHCDADSNAVAPVARLPVTTYVNMTYTACIADIQ